MNKITYLILVLSVALISCQEEEKKITTDLINNPISASEDAGETKMPKMVFEEEVFDFGKITQGEKVNYSYKFKNTGDANLIITSAKGSCGCTVPQWPKEPIPPGGEGKIDVVFDSNGKSGTQHKQVTVVANTVPATNVVAIKGEIIAPSTN
jgi:hypothetical protein